MRASLANCVIRVATALLILGACDRSTLTPEPEPAEIRLDRSSLLLDDTASAQLTAKVLDADGKALEALPAGGQLVWSSSDATARPR